MTELKKLGKYEIRGELGQGAMGIVYDGFDPMIGRRVALKTVRRRIDEFGLTQPVVMLQPPNRIRVQIPGETNPDRIRQGLLRTAHLEVRMVHENMTSLVAPFVTPGTMTDSGTGVPDEIRKEEVKAYVILQPGLTRAEVPPEAIIEHARKYLAPFKVPRYIEYRSEFPRTPSNKIRKPELQKEKSDLRADSWDRVDNTWR